MIRPIDGSLLSVRSVGQTCEIVAPISRTQRCCGHGAVNAGKTAHHAVQQPPLRRPSGAVIALFMTVFVDLVGFGIVLPLQPFYAQTLGAAPRVWA